MKHGLQPNQLCTMNRIAKHDKIPSPITHPFCLFPHKIEAWVLSPKLDNSRLFYFENLTSDPTDSRVTGKVFSKRVIICIYSLVPITNPRSIIIGHLEDWRLCKVLSDRTSDRWCFRALYPPSLMRQCIEHTRDVCTDSPYKARIRYPHMPTIYVPYHEQLHTKPLLENLCQKI